MNRRTVLLALGTIALAASVGITGCARKEAYTVGAVLALSGAGQTYGQDIRQGMEIALEEVNADGGIEGIPLRVIYEDTGSDPSRAKEAAVRLMEEQRVPAIIGGILSSETLSIAPLAQESGVVLLSPASSSPQITGAGEFIFRIYPSDVVEGTMTADFMLNVMGKSRIVIVAVNNDYGQGLKTVFAKRYRTVPNREIVEVFNFEQGQTDWSAEVAKIRELRPDGLYLVGYPQEMLGFLEALEEAGVEVPVVASRSFDVEMLKIPAAEGVIFPRDPFVEDRTEESERFAAAYRRKVGADPSIWAANGADAVHLLAQAISEVGDRPRDMQKWLSTVREWKGASGILTFDPNGDVEKLPVISIVHEGEFITYKEYQEGTGSAS